MYHFYFSPCKYFCLDSIRTNSKIVAFNLRRYI